MCFRVLYVASELFSSSVAMRFTSRSAFSSPCIALSACPDSAGGGFGRAHAVYHGVYCTRVIFDDISHFCCRCCT